MTQQSTIDYQRIAKAIDYIRQHAKEQPKLEDIAKAVHLSPYHFQRLFTDWAGVSPKQFLQYLNLEYAKTILKNGQKSLSDTAFETGLSGTGRLHDLFVKIEGMTPGVYKSGGNNLRINYSFENTPFGKVLIASTTKGICYMAFVEKKQEGFIDLQNHFPNALFQQSIDAHQQNALHIFTKEGTNIDEIKLHIKGSAFQLKVWNALLKIPKGDLSTYGSVAQEIEQPKASRAVGTAIGRNPVAFLIPCHRVIRSSGEFGNYMWGPTRKTAMIGWEATF